MTTVQTDPIQGDRQRSLERMKWLAKFLDNAIVIPGLGFRVGYDAIIGLVPVAGDIITSSMSLYIVHQSWKLGVRKGVLFQMLGNIVLDLLIGEIPGLGDIGDFFFKSNTRNLALLGRELGIPELAQVGTERFRPRRAAYSETAADGADHDASTEPLRKRVENLAVVA